MKKNNSKKQENTLFSYFTKVKEPTKKETLSAVIAKTSVISQHTTTISSVSRINKTDDSNDANTVNERLKVIDLTESPDTSSSPIPTNSQTSASSLSSSQLHTFEMKNNCKYNQKGWSAQSKKRGPLKSSQDASLSQTEQPRSPADRMVLLKKPRITPKVNYEWLSADDVKPYSSNYQMNEPRIELGLPPTIIPQFPSSYGGVGTMVKQERGDRYNSPSNNSSQDDFWGDGGGGSGGGRKKWDGGDITPYSKIKQERRKLPIGFSSGPKNTSPYFNSGSSNINARSMASLTHPDSRKEYNPELSSEQQRVLNMVMKDKTSLFFTGSAGTGKSVLLRAIIDKLRVIYGNQLAVTASTGIAACNINGCTLHSFGGIGIAKEKASILADKIRYKNKKALERWRVCKVLIIDEISMVDAELFDKLEEIARNLRQSPEPFGGIQVLVTGDFFQLPPVSKDRGAKFAFESFAWNSTIKHTVMLSKVFRQKDGTFVSILNEMRLGHLSSKATEIFRSLSRVPEGDDDIEPTELYPLRNQVDLSNIRRLEALKGEMVEWRAKDSGDPRKMEACIAPTTIQLKLHAQVMLLKNIDIDLVNGSIGVVIGFVGRGEYRNESIVSNLRTAQRQQNAFTVDDGSGKIDMSQPWPVVKFPGDRILVLERETWSVELPGGQEVSSRSQLPLMLAWAISIHKSQGQTLDRVKVDLGKVFEKGQAYVALSRATSLEKLQILNFDPSKVMAHPTVTGFYKTLKTIAD